MKIFNLYESDDVLVEDPGLKRVINLKGKIVLKSHGKIRGKFANTKINLVERLVNLLSVSGHRGKKHMIMTKKAAGKYSSNMKIVLGAFKIIQDKTNTNPVQILVKAIETASPREEITTIEYGGAKYPQAVDCSPSRRVGLTLRLIVHGAYDKSFGKKTKIEEALANEIIFASKGANESLAVAKKNEMEKQANSAR
jgi:small subunit ribosomal protein S7